MVAVIVLSAVEAEAVRRGSVDEPGYRPFPSGRRGRQEELNERAIEDGLEPLPLSDRQAPQLRPQLASHRWTRHGVHLALLVAASEAGTSFEPEAHEVVALARAEGSGRSAIDGVREVLVGPWDTLDPPLPLRHLLPLLTGQQREKLLEVFRRGGRPLPEQTASAVNIALVDAIPDFARRASDLLARGPIRRQRRELLEKREANATALSILTPRWRGLSPVEGEPPPMALAAENSLRQGGSEDDYITDDSAVFPEWERSARPVRGWWSFSHQGQQLWIKNINVSAAESATGADLVYVRDDPAAIVLVQYKLLSELTNGERFIADDGRLGNQIDRMISRPSDASPPSTMEEHRLGNGYAFVKFIDDQDPRGLEADELTHGSYFPAAFIRQLLTTPGEGPRGGRKWRVPQERRLDSQVFIGLVRSCWIGSRGVATADLADLLQAPSPLVTIAFHQRVP